MKVEKRPSEYDVVITLTKDEAGLLLDVIGAFSSGSMRDHLERIGIITTSESHYKLTDSIYNTVYKLIDNEYN